MSIKQLEEISAFIQREVDEKHIPGAIAAVYKDGKQVFQTGRGMADMEKGQRIAEDTIFRMYSMTKPITAAAAMLFAERGQLRLEDPVSRYLPEFSEMKVLDKARVIPAIREIKIMDLLNMTSGIVYPDPDPAGRKMEEYFDKVHLAIREGRAYTTREVMGFIASCPLAFQPGTGWRYGLSADVLAAVLEVIDSRKISEIYKEDIFDPLDMKDTGFYVPKEKQHRFAQLYRQKYQYDEEKKIKASSLEIDFKRHLGLTDCLQPPGYESGGAGICSTLRDYSRFAQMLAGGGALDGIRILDRSTVETFTQNQLKDVRLLTVNFPQLNGYGYSSLMRTRLIDGEPDDFGVAGEFGWDGWTGPYFTVDLKDNFTFIYLVQISGYSNIPLMKKLRNIAYTALDWKQDV